MACTEGCRTKDHASYAECLKAKKASVAYANEASGHDYTKSKQWDKRLELYAKARKEGMQPRSTQRADIEHAIKKSDQTGEAFQA